MQKIGSFVAFALVWLVIQAFRLVPVRWVYILSDGLGFILCCILGYRKKLVYRNLKNAFPEKSDKEIHTIARKFYRNLSDYILESLKAYTLPPAKIRQRVTISNPEEVERWFREGKNLLLLAGHYGSWELIGIGLAPVIPFHIVTVYMPIANPFLENYLKKRRSRTGIILVSATAFKKQRNRHFPEPNVLIMVADQAPGSRTNCYWTRFLNQDTAVAFGPERMAVLDNRPVIFAEVSQPRRGHYTITFRPLIENPRICRKYKISEAHTRAMEEEIRQRPDLWIWSHNRWKHKRPVDYPVNT